MSRRVLVIDLAGSTAPVPRIFPRVIMPLGPGRAAVSLDDCTAEEVLAELLAAGLPVRCSKVVVER